MSRNIVLIGMPGCGKSTLGRIISEKLGRCAIDLDDYIEANEKKSIKEMFAISEDFFRDAETKYSILAGELNSCIIATGGGIVKRKENIKNLKKNSIIVFINRPIEDIMKDIDAKTRPLLSGGTEAIYKLYNERMHLYKESCDIEIINVGKIEEVADLIIKNINTWERRIIMEEKSKALKKHMEWKGKLLRLVKYPVYISIDKDVFDYNVAYTNWDQGTMTEDFIDEFFEAIDKKVTLIGGDICGEYPISYSNLANMKYQKRNMTLNKKLMEAFNQHRNLQ